MENKISFKVFAYWNELGKPEVRRFATEKCNVANFQHLTAKLEDLYQGLRGKTYTVSWKDMEGDDVIISSMDELLIALGAMQGLVKLYVSCKEEKPKPMKLEPVKDVVTESANTYKKYTFSDGNSIICDGCENPVVGFRYKCTTCNDFDLCSKCEAAGLHPQHFMVRINMPTIQNLLTKATIRSTLHALKSKRAEFNNYKTLLNSCMQNLGSLQSLSNQTGDVEMGQEDSKISDADKASAKFDASTTDETKQKVSPDKVEGWTVINREKEPELATAPVANNAASAPQEPESSSKTEPTPGKPKQANLNPKAHIDTALQNMTAMGFINDGGWLTKLLESKDGNIAAVLNMLTPVNIQN